MVEPFRLRSRFAPSPTGPLHLGHAYSALMAQDLVAGRGEFLLRIEDIDQSRARPEWEKQIYEDLHWLGLEWPLPVMRQSGRMDIYRAALTKLWEMGLLYPCTCSRRDIRDALSAPQEGDIPVGPDGPVYPGTCRKSSGERSSGDPLPHDRALRLDMARAMARLDQATIEFEEIGPTGTNIQRPTKSAHEMIEGVGDIVLSRKDMGTSYHLSVVIDDAAQDITHVVRGADLSEATFIHVVLQRLLGLPTPVYLHHDLIRDENGKRLAKRDDARAIALYRVEGATPDDIRRMVGLSPPAP